MGWGSFNQNSTGSFNQNLLGSRNQNTVGSHNQNVVGSQNQNAGGSFNQNASGSFNQNAAGGAELVMSSVRMGGGYPSGTGFFGGYGRIDRSDYATPANLGPIPWTLDFADGNGWPAFPAAQRFDPNALGLKLEWQTGDWDPGLRYWSLPFDPTLTEWLQDVDLASPAVMAAREFAAQQALWRANAAAEPASPVQGLIYRSSVEWMFRASDQDTAETRAEKRRLYDRHRIRADPELDAGSVGRLYPAPRRCCR